MSQQIETRAGDRPTDAARRESQVQWLGRGALKAVGGAAIVFAAGAWSFAEAVGRRPLRSAAPRATYLAYRWLKVPRETATQDPPGLEESGAGAERGGQEAGGQGTDEASRCARASLGRGAAGGSQGRWPLNAALGTLAGAAAVGATVLLGLPETVVGIAAGYGAYHALSRRRTKAPY